MRRGQRGVAAVTAILIVAVAAAAAALMLSQQAAMLDQTMLVASRAQADEYAAAGLDWARGVLAQDARAGTTDHLEEGWARPIVGMPVERAVVAGAIADEQGKFNLNNLVLPGNTASGPDVQLLRRLLAALDLPADLADGVVDWIDRGDDLGSGAGAESGYYLSLPRPYRAANAPMVNVDELYRVRGFDAKAVERLRPHVTALPARTTINANTAGETLLAAAFGAPREKVAAMVEARRKTPFANPDAFRQAYQLQALGTESQFGVNSGWFMVRVQVTQDDVHVGSEALAKREPGGATAIIWRRPRY